MVTIELVTMVTTDRQGTHSHNVSMRQVDVVRAEQSALLTTAYWGAFSLGMYYAKVVIDMVWVELETSLTTSR